jgi:outer membrane biogenesis lipoprotein LolB
MARAVTLVLALACLSACASQHELAKCKGPLLVLNSSHWQPSATDVAALDKLCPEDR